MSVNAYPAAYLRRSYVDANSPGDISRESQRRTVRTLAAADGHNGNLVEYDDWGVSADIAKSAKRTDYARLLSDMESGRVSAVYAFDVDRLYRDPRDLIRLQDAAQRHGVKIVTTSGTLPIGDGDDPTQEAFAFMQAVWGRMELQKIKKRNRAGRDTRTERGDAFGHPPYGYQRVKDADGRVVFVPDPEQPLQPVYDAFLEAGSFAGAARLLNRQRIRSARDKRWAANVVSNIIRREHPEWAPRFRAERTVAARGAHIFSRLLRCPIKPKGQPPPVAWRMLTPRVNRVVRKGRYIGTYNSYQCFDGRHDPEHPRPYMIAESVVLDWAKVEASRLRIPERVRLADENRERRAELAAQRERVGMAMVRGMVSLDAAETEQAAIDAELDRLNAAEAIVDVPTIDWDWPAPELNAVLRSLWEYIELDEQMRPIRAEWRVPEWRR